MKDLLPKHRWGGLVAAWLLNVATAIAAENNSSPSANPPPKKEPTVSASTNSPSLATFGGGCFWCLEAVFEKLPGVQSVVSGYAGGAKPNPTYKEVCTGDTGHAEVVQIRFDPAKISYEKLLDVFWLSHDPTTLNRQGADVGTQYRSVIFFHSPEQHALAERSKAVANGPARFKNKIVTEIAPLPTFYTAEEYHQDYFKNHPSAPYCQVVIAPKLLKLEGKLPKE